MSALYAVAFLAMGIHIPFFPLWLRHVDFSPEQIGLILAIPMIVRIISVPVLTGLGDKARDRADVLFLSAVAAFFASLGYFFTPDYWLVLAISVLIAAFWTPHVPLIDSIAQSGVRRFATDYTRLRIWGSIAFVVINLAGGAVLGVFGAGAVPALFAASLSLMVVTALLAPRLGKPRISSPLGGGFLKGGSALWSRPFLLLAGACGLIMGSHGFLYAFGSIYWLSLGIDDATIGILWAWGVVAEVALFAVFTRSLGFLNSKQVIILGGSLAVLRWALFPLIWPLGGGLPGFFFLQTLHAFSTGLMLIGIQKVIVELIGEDQAGAAQGVAYLSNGTAMALVTLGAGYLYEGFGSGGYFAMAVLAATGTLFALMAQPQRSALGG
ncbi:MFS transporter [Tianweitania sediminis]|nr:MFS transporter [Tianweitania sediminis]